jgi:hypothetical protein
MTAEEVLLPGPVALLSFCRRRTRAGSSVEPEKRSLMSYSRGDTLTLAGGHSEAVFLCCCWAR